MADTDRSDLRQIKIYSGLLALLGGVVVLKQLSFLFIPFSLALLFFFLCNGLVARLTSAGFPRRLVLTGVMLLLLAGLFLIGLLLYSGASTLVERFPHYSQRLVEMGKLVVARLHLPEATVRPESLAARFDPQQITRLITTTLGTFSSFLGDAVLVLLFLMFMLGGSESLKTRLRRSLAPDHASSFLRIYTAIDGRIQRYVVIKTAMSLATALLAGAILALGGFDFVLLSALLVFFFNFIPTFGSVVGTVFPVLIGFLQYGLCWRVGIVLLGLMAMQFTMGNVVEPKITGRRLNLSPVVILASLLFWGWLWGMVGMVLSVPLTSVVKIGLEQIPSLRPVAAVLGGGGGFSERTP